MKLFCFKCFSSDASVSKCTRKTARNFTSVLILYSWAWSTWLSRGGCARAGVPPWVYTVAPHFHERKSTHIPTLCRRASETSYVILVPWDIMGSKKVRNVMYLIEFSCLPTQLGQSQLLIKLKMSWQIYATAVSICTKFRFSEKTKKINEIFTLDLMFKD
jgi:hypothetical protein